MVPASSNSFGIPAGELGVTPKAFSYVGLVDDTIFALRRKNVIAGNRGSDGSASVLDFPRAGQQQLQREGQPGCWST